MSKIASCQHVRVGVAVLVVRDNKVLIGKRLASHGAGTYQLPGGHLEMGESWEQCAIRELKEETGLDVADPVLFHVTNDIMDAEKKHYITIFMRCVSAHGEPQALEPDKCAGWEWMQWSDSRIPKPRFLPLQHLIESGMSPVDRH